FTHRICRNVFPEPGSKFRPDSEPEYCVARGLARLGRLELQSERFKTRVTELADSDLVPTTIENRLPEFIERVSISLAMGIVNEPLRQALHDWKTGTIKTLRALESHMTDLVKAWLGNDG